MSGTQIPQKEGTLGALRELTADLPDDTRIQIAIRSNAAPDDFNFEWVDGESVDLTFKPVVVLEVNEPWT